MLYYVSKISNNMARTPEGFLLCQNVPIARIGKQEYMANELPIEYSDPNEIIMIYREAEDVFSPSAIASFEGKPVTNEHPPELLTPQNAANHSKGHAQNVRQVGEYLVADLFINDALLIAEIENGKREVSCGYNAAYENRDGRLCQMNIEGNHIAVVDSGRAGERVSIRDSNPNPKPERSKKMSKKAKNKGITGALANLWPHFTKDAEPEDLVEAVEELVEKIKEEAAPEELLDAEAAKAPAKDAEYEAYHKLLYEALEGMNKKLDDLYKEVEEIKKAEYVKVDSDPLAELEEELTEDAYEEEEVVADPDVINEQEDETGGGDEYAVVEVEKVLDKAGYVMPKEGRPKNILDSKAALKELKKIKPIVAGIKDAKQRKMMADSMAKMIRHTYGIPASGQGKTKAGYNAIANAKQSTAKHHQDSQQKRLAKLDEIAQKLEKERLGKK